MDDESTGGDERRSCLWESNGSDVHFWIDHRCDQEFPIDDGACFHGDQDGEMTCERRGSLCGCGGVRVGEASHLAPLQGVSDG